MIMSISINNDIKSSSRCSLSNPTPKMSRPRTKPGWIRWIKYLDGCSLLIYAFAQSTDPVFEDEGTLGCESTTTIDSAKSSARASIRWWPLGQLLRSIAGLPEELQLATICSVRCSVFSPRPSSLIETSCMLLSDINYYSHQNVTKLGKIVVALIPEGTRRCKNCNLRLPHQLLNFAPNLKSPCSSTSCTSLGPVSPHPGKRRRISPCSPLS